MPGFVSVSGRGLVDGIGRTLRLRGVNLGGWLLMEGFLIGFPSTESKMRRALLPVLGEPAYRRFFHRYHESFYGEADAAFIASIGLNCVRIGINYRHLESDDQPFELIPGGFDQLDRAIRINAKVGLYTVIDLHAAQGFQNQAWHCDNPSHLALLWDQRQFQDRVVWLWEQIASRYQSDRSVAGYNLLNEPADESGRVLGSFYRRLAGAVRQIDPHHVLFLDGNRGSREFELLGDPLPNAVYSVHQYPDPGFPGSGPYPGVTNGKVWDRDAVERQFLERTAYMRRHGVPIWVSEFGPLYEGFSDIDPGRYRLLNDQLSVFEDHEASWSIWSYKDLGRVGLVAVNRDSPWSTLVRDVEQKIYRIGAEPFGGTTSVARSNFGQVFDLTSREFPLVDPFPFGMVHRVRRLIGEKLLADLLVTEFVELFVGLGSSQLDALTDSFRFDQCDSRDLLRGALAAATH